MCVQACVCVAQRFFGFLITFLASLSQRHYKLMWGWCMAKECPDAFCMNIVL